MSKSGAFLAMSAALALGASIFAAAPASAAPIADPFVAGAANTVGANVEKARLVCDAWGRCFRTRPRFYGPRFYGGGYGYRRGYGRGYGYRRGFRRW